MPRRQLLTKELMSILACPVCKSGLEKRTKKLVCKKCKQAYPIKDGIPILLPPDLR